MLKIAYASERGDITYKLVKSPSFLPCVGLAHTFAKQIQRRRKLCSRVVGVIFA